MPAALSAGEQDEHSLEAPEQPPAGITSQQATSPLRMALPTLPRPRHTSRHPDEAAWYDGNSGDETHSVGQKKPNAWVLYDMSGNVWEWCWDWYDKDEYKNRVRLSGDKRALVNQPTGPKNGINRSLRGGSYFSGTWFLRSSYRVRVGPEPRSGRFGFRLVLPSPSPA